MTKDPSPSSQTEYFPSQRDPHHKGDVRKSLNILKCFMFAGVVYSAYIGGQEKKLGNLGKSI